MEPGNTKTATIKCRDDFTRYNCRKLSEQIPFAQELRLTTVTNIGVNDYINKFRIEKAVDLLTHTDLSITEISEQLGFRYPRYFSSVFKQAKGVLPTTFRKQTNG